MFETSPGGVVVRSSALDEDISARGLYSSVAVEFPSFQTVGEALRSIWDDSMRTAGQRSIPALVQTKVPARLFGHLSNEARLREDRRDWVLEVSGDFKQTRASGLRALRTDRVPLDSVDLHCSTAHDLRAVLRRVAGALTIPGRRCHIEWLWDGERLWIVQCDLIPELHSERPRGRGEPQAIPALAVFRDPTPDDVDIPKLRCIAEYVAAGLPHAELAVLRDEAIITALARGDCPPSLRRDLEALAEAGVVVRSDYAREGDDFEILLPRTETEHSATALLDYLTRTTALVLDKGVAPGNVAFLTHVFIPADASAWSVAAPLSPAVRIDATYGLPDGLNYYTHDSYDVNVRRGVVRSRVRCKDSILLCESDGAWRTSRLGAPWDWRPALSDDEVTEIGTISKRLADYLGRPVETMFFVRAHMAGGELVALPWVHRTENVSTLAIPATESHFPSATFVLRSGSDLPVLRVALDDVPPGERLLVRIRPEGEVLHDAGFLADVINELRPEKCTVELAGSGLAHVFYELQRAGVQVRTTDPLEPSEAPAEPFDKLVRDLIPEVISAKGERVVVYEADGDELLELLKRKAVEESFEVAGAQSTDNLIEELGDLIDVLDALCTVSGTDLETVRSWAEKKRQERGGFERGVVLVETRDTSLEEALAGTGRGFSVAPDLGAEVQDARRPSRREREPTVLEDSVVLPFSDAAGVRGEPFRLVIGDTEFHVRFGPAGIEIERAGRAHGDPNQLAMDV